MLLKKEKKGRKKPSVLQFAVLLLAAAFAIVALACEGGDLVNTGGKPDTGALEAKITEAENAKTGVVVNTTAANVSAGVSWVIQAEMDAFNAVIEAAKQAKNAKTQAEVDAAVATLTAAITTFNAAKKAGSKTPIITTELVRVIAAAENAKSGVDVNTDAENVALGAPWVTQAEKDALDNAITVAENAKNAATQAEADAAVSALEAAIATFNTAKKTGSKMSGFTANQLADLIAEAIAAKTDVVVNTDAANVAQGTSWVPQEEMTALENAITAAQGASGNIDSVYLALRNALTAFSDALDIGTKINFDQLTAMIDNAEAAKAGVEVASSAANVAEGTHWVTQTVMDTFNSAIATAESAKTALTQAAVDTAVTNLSTAIATFTSARGMGTKAAPTTIDYGTTLSWGSSVYTPDTLGLVPGNTTTELNLNWLTIGNSTIGTRTTNIRFIEGTKNAGYSLIEETGSVASATSSTGIYHYVTVTGLVPGKSYQYSVCVDGTNWSQMYDYKVPAATGTWKFAVISDPQLTTMNVDTNSRYPATNVTTANGWLETMAKVAAADASFIVSCGDQVDQTITSATVVSEYTRFFAPPELRSLPLAPVIGNHDTLTHVRYYYHLPNDPRARESAAAMGNYYYLYNNILFVGLNTSQGPTSRSAAATYITQFQTTIQNAKTAHAGNYDWLIVHHHKSTASVAEHLADADIQYYVEAGFEKVMSDQGVDFVLAGHDHVYARSYPLAGRDQGLVSVPNKTFNAASGSTWNNPGNPVYLTFTTASGLKYYKVSADPYFVYNNELYNKNNSVYPYLGESTDGDGSTYFGSTQYMTYHRMPVSNAAFVQPYIPSYTVVEVSNNPAAGTRSITFRTYPITTASGTSPGASQAYSFNADTPYDSITVTK